MAFTHGVYTEEIPTSLISPTQTIAGLPVIIGTAPIHLASEGEISNINKPQLVYSYAEAVKLFGFLRNSSEWGKYTLCEFIYSQFALYAMSPCVLINVFDPAKHKTKITGREYEITDTEMNLGTEILFSGFEATSRDVNSTVGEDEETEDVIVYKLNEDYSLTYDENGNAIFLILSGGALSGKNHVYLTYTKLTPEAVTAYDIIGGVNALTGEYTGLELINRVFPKFRLIPGLIAAPKWSENPAVAAVMRAKAENINGFFTAQAVIDIPSDSNGADVYSKVAEWKNQNNYQSEHQIVCWPKVKLGDDVYHLSTQLIGLMNSVDSSNEDVPYESPSNHLLQINSCVNAAGNEINLGCDEANYLNSQGVVTALNWIGGWRAWGNRTGTYPASTDAKDCFIPVRRMFDWIRNEFTTTFWQEVDVSMTTRLIRTIINSFNVRLNGLAAREMILGGRIEFLSTENPITDLFNGTLKFHIYYTPPVPAETIIGIFEYDPAYFETLFSSMS